MKASKFFTFAAACVVLRCVLAAWLLSSVRPELRSTVSFEQIDSLYWLGAALGVVALVFLWRERR